MDDLTVGREKAARFFHLFLRVMLTGFDEMEMQERLELVELLGFMLQLGFENIYGRLLTLEKRVMELEKKT
ncbi:MAG TPA: hypothetical protein EYP23_00645 [Thermoplasmata archaeon]|nr:hypothetical protein [Thermoplasmata archaeon]